MAVQEGLARKVLIGIILSGIFYLFISKIVFHFCFPFQDLNSVIPEIDYTILMICMVVTTQDELQKVFQLRTEVFVNEQHVPIHLEMDALDKVAIHVLCTENLETIGCGRIILDGSTAWIGRVAVKKNFRNRGFGRELMLNMMTIALEKGATTISLHAQLPVVEFYQKLGFSAHGETFMDAGIEHIEMNLQVNKT